MAEAKGGNARADAQTLRIAPNPEHILTIKVVHLSLICRFRLLALRGRCSLYCGFANRCIAHWDRSG